MNLEPIEIVGKEKTITYDPNNFSVRILNSNTFRDYREACKITEGIHTDVRCRCTLPPDSLCVRDDEQSPNQVCTNYSCIKNTSWIPTDWDKYWRKQLTALHSPIRSINIRIKDFVPRSVIMQYVRHTAGHPQPFVQSSRPDWTGKPRSNDPYEPKWMIMDFTPESLLFMFRKRLCTKAEIFSREIMKEWKKRLSEVSRESLPDASASDLALLHALSECAVPQCEVLGANKCPELRGCGKYLPYIE